MSIVGPPGPLPTKHIFLHEVAKQPTGSKVRFLGCVTGYEISTGALVLEHAFPCDRLHPTWTTVDITLILETVKPEHLQTGTWLNVIGYVNRSALKRDRITGSEPGRSEQMERTKVQALLAWNAGPVRVGDYERILSQQHDVGTLV